MRLDELRAGLRDVAARGPHANVDARAAVLGRGRHLVRRRRSGRAFVAVVAAAVVGVGLGVWRSDPGPGRLVVVSTPSTPPSVSSTSDAALLWSDNRGLVLGDPNTGLMTRISTDRFAGFLYSARVSDGVVFGSTLGPSARLLPSGDVRSVGSGAPFAASDGRSVYLSTGATSLELIDTNGKLMGGPWTVPAGYELSGKDFGLPGRAVVGGVLVQTTENNSDHTLAIWNPRTNSLRSLGNNRWGVIDTYTAPGASTSLIAWIRAGCQTPGCDIELTDSTTGRTREVPAPAGHYGYFYGGSFSPDGNRLAVFASTVSKPVNPAVDLTIVNTANGNASVVRHAHLSVGEPDAVAEWSPNGDAVFFSSFGDVFVHRTATDTAEPLPFHFATPTRFVVVPRTAAAQPLPPTTTPTTPVPTPTLLFLPPLAYKDNGPLSRQLEALARPLVPRGSRLVSAQDLVGETPDANVKYGLPNGQTLYLVQEQISLPLPSGISPQSLITNPITDNVTKLATGSWLARIAHTPGATQVILMRPSGTFVDFINVQLFTPYLPGGHGPIVDPSIKTAYTLDSLADAVRTTFDTRGSGTARRPM